MLAWIEILGMAASTIGLVSRGWPGDLLTVAAMTALTTEVGRMITRIGRTAVTELQRRCPAGGAMTHIALLTGNKVPAVFAGGCDVVMTA